MVLRIFDNVDQLISLVLVNVLEYDQKSNIITGFDNCDNSFTIILNDKYKSAQNFIEELYHNKKASIDGCIEWD